jgi:hypothetical protein
MNDYPVSLNVDGLLSKTNPTSNFFLGPYNTGDEYNLLLEALMANTANQKLAFNFSSPVALNIGGTLNVGQDVLAFILQVKTPFDGVSPYVTLGSQAVVDYFKAASSIDLSVQDTYIILPDQFEFITVIQPKLYLNLGGSTVGDAILYMIYNNGI